MEVYVLDQNFQKIQIVDFYSSLIWTDRFRKCGDFEIYAPIDLEVMKNLAKDNYLECSLSRHTMIIEGIKTDVDDEQARFFTVTGRSLESILDRRIVWKQKTLSGNFQNAIETLLNENVIKPEISERKIPNFIFKRSTDPYIASLTIDTQYTGDNLYEVVTTLCEECGIGFSITRNENNQFVFELLNGTDRSYNQSENPYVVFSFEFDNLQSTTYSEDNSTLKNVALIGGEGEGNARKYSSIGNETGLTRRELFVDARDISSESYDSNGNKTTISNSTYISLLQQRGLEKLADNIEEITFEGEADPNAMFKYEEDYFMGDILQIYDEYGHSAFARVLELIISDDESGFSMYPTFGT